MATELARFLIGGLILMLPGIALAEALKLGRGWLERWINGASLSLAMAIYLASAISQFNLNWFYGVWICIGIASITAAWFWGRWKEEEAEASIRRWILLVLLIVGVSRFAVALPRALPEGFDPPRGHLILARKIQLEHHAVTNWLPFSDAAVTYPTGGMTLIAVWSTISHLPVEAVFKDLIPLLGVLTTAQMFVLIRAVTGNANAGLWGALAYGLWVGDGSIDYFLWGGLPNELGMLLFISMLSACLAPWSWRKRLGVMAVLYAGVLLVHHHVILASGGVLVMLLLVTALRGQWRAAWLLAGAMAIAAGLDGFAIFHYLGAAAGVQSTNALQSEGPLQLWESCGMMGYPFLLAAVGGMLLSLRRGAGRLHPAAWCAVAAMAAMFVACEYILPIWTSPPGHLHRTAFVPSRFLTDIDYFLPVFAGVAVAVVQERLRLATWAVVVVMLLVAVSPFDLWREMVQREQEPGDLLAACDWIRGHTSPDTILLDAGWPPYLAWRRATGFLLPDSERRRPGASLEEHVDNIVSGTIPPDSPDMKIVQIVQRPQDAAGRVLWAGPTGMRVVQRWPR